MVLSSGCAGTADDRSACTPEGAVSATRASAATNLRNFTLRTSQFALRTSLDRPVLHFVESLYNGPASAHATSPRPCSRARCHLNRIHTDRDAADRHPDQRRHAHRRHRRPPPIRRRADIRRHDRRGRRQPDGEARRRASSMRPAAWSRRASSTCTATRIGVSKITRTPRARSSRASRCRSSARMAAATCRSPTSSSATRAFTRPSTS